MAIVAHHSNKKVRAKMADRGFPVMFVGYPDNHKPDTYRFWNPATQGILTSRDVQWLSKTYGQFLQGQTQSRSQDLPLHQRYSGRTSNALLEQEDIDIEAPLQEPPAFHHPGGRQQK